MEPYMTLKYILLEEAKTTYTITDKLFHRVTDSDLSWKPTTGKNWMTIGQLLMHCASFGCGKAIQGFVKGDWGIPEGVELKDLNADQHVPPVTMLPSVDSVKQALELLANDRNLSLRCIEDTEEARLLAEKITAPWGGPEASLFQHLLLMIAHLNQHKGQLFYYLKLMGNEINTSDLWGA
ncbi:MAG: DinB family protein [Bacteroidota bacterium]